MSQTSRCLLGAGVLLAVVLAISTRALVLAQPDLDAAFLVQQDKRGFRYLPAPEVYHNPNEVPFFVRPARRSRELFGKRFVSLMDAEPRPGKRRSRELFGKRSASAEEVPFTSQEVYALANYLMDRPRRARASELFGR